MFAVWVFLSVRGSVTTGCVPSSSVAAGAAAGETSASSGFHLYLGRPFRAGTMRRRLLSPGSSNSDYMGLTVEKAVAGLLVAKLVPNKPQDRLG